MSDELAASAQPRANTLQYVTEQTYVAKTAATPAGVLLALAGGMAAAAIAGIGALLLMVSLPYVPALVLYFLPGLVVGAVLARLFTVLRLRGSAIAWVLGITCGVATSFFFHYGLYLRMAYMVRDKVVEDLQKISPLNARQKALLASVQSHPVRSYDAFVIFPKTSHHGFVGYMIIRGPNIGGYSLLQVVMVTAMAVGMGRRAVERPFCESCGTWFKEPRNAMVVPTALADPLVLAIRSGDPEEVMTLHELPHETGASCAIARVHTCPKCGERFADVVIKTFGRQAGQWKKMMSPVRITPQMLEALKFEPGTAALAQPVEENAAAAPDPSETGGDEQAAV